ncbi:hypothetical protein HY419_01070 [candidate division WWE3 bacterium]|nr:hypothetical protein [candidate division WWE3 bacterium]
MLDKYLTAKDEDEKTLSEDLRKVKSEKILLWKGRGCEKCGSTGYQGRLGIFEVLNMNDKIGKLILEHRPASEIETVGIENGMVTLLQDGYFKVLEGITSLEEVLRVATE